MTWPPFCIAPIVACMSPVCAYADVSTKHIRTTVNHWIILCMGRFLPLLLISHSKMHIAEIDVAVQSNSTARGFEILVARLTARNINRIFSLCHYFAIMNQLQRMNLDTWERTNGRIERQKRASRQHERLQARACGYSETARGKRHHRARGKRAAADPRRLDSRQGRGCSGGDGHQDSS